MLLVNSLVKDYKSKESLAKGNISRLGKQWKQKLPSEFFRIYEHYLS